MGLGETLARVGSASPPPSQTAAEGGVPGGMNPNMTAHIATAATLGGGLASIIEWLIETGFHTVPPEAVDSGISAICIFMVSLVMRKVIG